MRKLNFGIIVHDILFNGEKEVEKGSKATKIGDTMFFDIQPLYFMIQIN